MFSSTGNLFAKNLSLKSTGIFLPFFLFSSAVLGVQGHSVCPGDYTCLALLFFRFLFPWYPWGTKGVDPFFALRSLAISSSLKLHLSPSSDGPQISVSELQTERSPLLHSGWVLIPDPASLPVCQTLRCLTFYMSLQS